MGVENEKESSNEKVNRRESRNVRKDEKAKIDRLRI